MFRDGIQEQHQEIDRATAELRDLLAEQLRTDRLRASVAELAVLIERHFESEGRSRVFTKLPLELPRLASRLDALKREHVELLAELRACTVSLSELGRDVAAPRLRAWLKHLAAHEEREQTLLERAQFEETPFSD